jgi:hypothetical protein
MAITERRDEKSGRLGWHEMNDLTSRIICRWMRSLLEVQFEVGERAVYM